jgi:hypothetical protein
MPADAVALKVAAVAPADTVTDAGTVSQALFVFSVRLDPPVGAAVFRVTVHVLTPPGPRLAGLHDIPETRTVPPPPAAALKATSWIAHATPLLLLAVAL